MNELVGKHAFVCGGSDGIGKAVALELASMGAVVTLCARNEQKLKEVKDILPTPTLQKHQYLCADFNNPKELEYLIKNFASKNKVHILVNNTGGPAAGLAIEAEMEDYLNAFNQHLICNQILVKSFVEHMKSDHYGRVINIISTSVKAPLKGLGVSNTIRGAVANWAKTLANELGVYGITVNNILPGATKTKRLLDIIVKKAQKSEQNVEDIEKEMLHEIPLARFAEPEEIAYAVAFLASSKASYINGINLPVDGGRTPNL